MFTVFSFFAAVILGIAAVCVESSGLGLVAMICLVLSLAGIDEPQYMDQDKW